MIMARIIKQKPDPHLVIVDTNILWCKDKGPAVNPEFDTFWAEHEELTQLELAVPEVVRGELLFQQTTSGTKSLDKISEGMKEISNVTSANYRQRVTKQQVHNRIITKFDKWLRARKGIVLPIPVERIDWKALCESAIWRKPPFSFDPKDSDNEKEKGFRDALIHETIISAVTSESRNINIAFICNDFLLRDTTAKKLSTNKRFTCYENLAAFGTFLKLTREKLTEQFIRNIVAMAAVKFYSPDDPDCMWWKSNIHSKLTANPEHFHPPEDDSSMTSWATPQNPGFGTAGLGLPHAMIALPPVVAFWVLEDAGVWKISNTEFQSLSGSRTYHWKTPITISQVYIKRGALAVAGSGDERRTLSVHFEVLWHANVKDDARFHDIDLDEVRFISRNILPLLSTISKPTQPTEN